MTPEKGGLGLGLDTEGPAEDAPEPEGAETDEAESAAADAVMEAMTSGNREAFTDALKTFVKLCMDSSDY